MKNILFCCIILLFAGCIKNNNNGNHQAHDIFPNKVGDSWVYLVNDTAYSFQDPGVATQYNMTISVTDSVQLPGNIRANIWVYDYPGGPDTNYVFQHEDTIFFVAKTSPYTDIVRAYIIPLVLHNTWQYVPDFAGTPNVTVDSQANIIVGQHQYEGAFRIQGYPGHPDDMFYINEWIEDYVGVVKRYYTNDHFSTNPFRHSTAWSLVSYHVE